MLSPLPNSHRRNARKLGRGQYARITPVSASILNNGAIVTIAFSAPVMVHARLDLRIQNRTSLSQTIISPTRITQTFNADVSGENFTFAPTPDAITTPTGAQVLGETGTFMLNPDDVLHTAGGNYFPPATSDVKLGVHFGVNDTSETGTYNPAPPPATKIVSITNNLDGSYTVVLDHPATTSGLPIAENTILIYDFIAGTYTTVTLQSQTDSVTFEFTADTGTTTGSLFLIAQNPSNWSPTPAFAIPQSAAIP